nr:MAG TPA: hypothetical protein [Caudoviricetes sp.]
MNDIQIFNNPEFGEIRTIEQNGEPWFVGKDVALALGYSDSTDALKKHVDDVDKQLFKPGDSPTLKMSNYGAYFINESGLYSLCFSSKLEGAKRFKRWVTSEVLPSIRKNGGYLAGQDQLTPEELMAKALLYANKTLAERDARISELTVQNQTLLPKAEYFDDLVDRNLLTSFRETAKEFVVPPKKFVNWLIEKKYVYRDGKGKLLPREDKKNEGLFEVKEAKNDKTKWSGVQTLITPKGRETFRLLYL